MHPICKEVSSSVTHGKSKEDRSVVLTKLSLQACFDVSIAMMVTVDGRSIEIGLRVVCPDGTCGHSGFIAVERVWESRWEAERGRRCESVKQQCGRYCGATGRFVTRRVD